MNSLIFLSFLENVSPLQLFFYIYILLLLSPKPEAHVLKFCFMSDGYQMEEELHPSFYLPENEQTKERKQLEDQGGMFQSIDRPCCFHPKGIQRSLLLQTY